MQRKKILIETRKKNNLQLRSNARLLKSKSENQDRIISVKSWEKMTVHLEFTSDGRLLKEPLSVIDKK